MDVRAWMVLLMAGFGAELMHNLTHLLKTREMADVGPFSEGAVTSFVLILLGQWSQRQGTGCSWDTDGWSSVCNPWDIRLTQILLGRAWKQGILWFLSFSQGEMNQERFWALVESWSKSWKHPRQRIQTRWENLKWDLFFGRRHPRCYDLEERARDEDDLSAIW